MKYMPVVHPVPHKEYEVGQRVRVYQSWFHHNNIRDDWYKEGTIMKVEPGTVNGWHIWYVIEKIVMEGKSNPKSFMIDTLADFFSDDGHVELLGAEPQLTFNYYKPWWK
jgi:hypothetical protein